MIGVAVFEDKEAYLANGNDPEQDAWFRKLRTLLQSDPKGLSFERVHRLGNRTFSRDYRPALISC